MESGFGKEYEGGGGWGGGGLGFRFGFGFGKRINFEDFIFYSSFVSERMESEFLERWTEGHEK